MTKLILTLILLSLLFHPYGNRTTLNFGISFGVSETCQLGYEFKGQPGFFAYCELK